MGGAWKNLVKNKNFDVVLEMVRKVNSLGMQVCCSMGMLTKEQAIKLKESWSLCLQSQFRYQSGSIIKMLLPHILMKTD